MQRVILALALVAPALAGYEWAGSFATTAAQSATGYTWSAQAVGCTYADPTMKLVVMSTTDTSSTELAAQATALETAIDGTCTVANSGDTLTPSASGTCYTLTFSTTVDATNGFTDSTFPIDTTGVSGIIFAGQHGPTEFERDTHYLYVTDSSVNAVNSPSGCAAAGECHWEEPVAEDSGATRYAYFSCNAAGTEVSYGEECTDDGCTPTNCGIGEVNATSPAKYIAGGYLHHATCASDGSSVTVEIWEDNSLTIASDVSAVTPDQTHTESPGCAVEEHDHSSGDDTTATCGTVSGASSTRLGLGSLLVAGLAFAFAN